MILLQEFSVVGERFSRDYKETSMNSEKENTLAKMIQNGFPVAQRPYRELADQLGETEEAVMSVIRSWKEEGKLREISAVMEGATIGYDSALACARVPQQRLQEVADIISSHPMVTHNYERNYDYNIWFTIAVPFSVGIESHLEVLSRMCGLDKMYPLRRTETFKVGVSFDFKKGINQTEKVVLPDVIKGVVLDEKSVRIVRALQHDLPVAERPFAALAEAHNLAEDDLLDFVGKYRGGALRRYIGTFRHRKMGISSNGMVVWNITPEEQTEKGSLLASASEVSHCYARNNFPGFDYSVYSMLHAPDQDTLHKTAARLSEKIGCADYLILESPTEYKKTRLRYFLPELDEWWEKNKPEVVEING